MDGGNYVCSWKGRDGHASNKSLTNRANFDHIP